MFIELHAMQNFSPANLNRDDTNNPKDCEFGGVRRARISSQCLKRAMRTSPIFAETTKVEIGTRTKYLVGQLSTRLVKAGKSEEEVLKILTRFVPEYASKLEKKDNEDKKTAVLIYLSEAEMASIVQALLDNWDSLADDKAMARLVKSLVKKHKGWTSAPRHRPLWAYVG